MTKSLFYVPNVSIGAVVVGSVRFHSTLFFVLSEANGVKEMNEVC